MGNKWLCCCCRSNTPPASPPQGSIDPPQSHPSQAPESSSGLSVTSIQNTQSASLAPGNDSGNIVLHQSHPSDVPESSSGPSVKSTIESIKNTVQRENTAENIDKFIKMLDDLLLTIKRKGEDVPTSSGLENLASTAESASQIVDYFTTEAKNLKDSKTISEELGKAATSLLDKIGGAHFAFIGFSLVAYSIQRYLQMKSNDDDCLELLENLTELAKEVKKFQEAMPEEGEKVGKAIMEIVVGVLTCCDYMEKRGVYRFFTTGVTKSQLQKTKETIQDLRTSLTLTATTHIALHVEHIEGQIPKRSLPSPSEPLEFKPEGIEDQIAEVKNLLDLEGSDQAIAVVIVGFGGSGKTTLADSATQSLNLSSKDLKFSRVILDQKTPDKRSHIVQLQGDIIYHLTGDNLHLENPKEGRGELRAAIAGKSCFLYVDNIVHSSDIEELLPRELLPQNSEKNSEKNSENQMPKTKIRILVTSRQNDLMRLFNIKKFEHHVRELPCDAAEKFLERTILQGGETSHVFDEGCKISKVAELCRNVPLLLSVFGNHLKEKRDKDSYDEAIKALHEGNINKFDRRHRDDEQLSEMLMYVYDKMNDEEAQEAFLDICTYFHGRPWKLVAEIVGSGTLGTLENKKLVNKSEAGTVIVHDILRVMGARKATGTRLMSYEEFFNINDKDSNLENVKGMVLKSPACLITLETRHLNAMRRSLRFLALGDWVRFEGPPCDRAFQNLRYLELGDLKDFPFQDVSKFEKLNVFLNCSKPGMELAQLPPSLKHLSHQIPQDCNEIARLTLKNLKSLKTFIVQTTRSVRLPQGLKLPASLEHLELKRCEQLLPETISHLSALQTLALDHCDLERLPQEFPRSVAVRSLSMQHCTNLISLPDNVVPSLCSLTDLNLMGCTRLEKLPTDLGTLTALQNLNIGNCKNLRLLPESFGGLKSLKTLALVGCISLQRLPDTFGMLSIGSLRLEDLDSLKELPQSMGDLPCLKSLTILSCPSLELVPDSVGQLTNLEELNVSICQNLRALPKSFDQLSSLKEMVLYDCPSLRRLPDGFQSLKTLKFMELDFCSSVVDLPACFEMLSSLEELSLGGSSFSSLPDGFGKLKKLKTLQTGGCRKLQTFPQGFENLATLEWLRLWNCPVLEGRTMDKIVKLQNCHHVHIMGSTKLIERWNEMEEENKNLPMMVQTSWDHLSILIY